jgi:hypothetical protein
MATKRGATGGNGAVVRFTVKELLEEQARSFDRFTHRVDEFVAASERRFDAIETANATMAMSIAALSTSLTQHATSAGHPASEKRLTSLAVEVGKIGGMVAVVVALILKGK